MDEKEYIDSIDASLPYRDESKWKAIIDQGIQISDNAAYTVLFETCRVPPDVPSSVVYRMIDYWSSHYDHPIKGSIMKAVAALMTDTALPEDDALRYLEEVALYPGLDGAAMILYEAAPKGNKNFLRMYDDVGRRWGRGGGGEERGHILI